MDISNYAGYVAATLTTISFIPQVVKVVQTKETQNISLWMYIIFTTGVFCWLIYGLIQSIFPVIFANVVTLILSSIILVYKIKSILKKTK